MKNGEFDESGITEILTEPGRKKMQYSNRQSFGTRDLANNLSDLKAQIAANQKGIILMQSLIAEYSLRKVIRYMEEVQQNCELAVRKVLKEIGRKKLTELGENNNVVQLNAVDFMDDGSRIQLAISIDVDSGSATFDFSGTSGQVYGNTNSPKSIVFSAIIYCLRCIVNRDIPLNQGVLGGIIVILPNNCILNPDSKCGVVGGNVLTSQRIVDVILLAFSAAANSMGDMSNLTFGGGKKNVAYYETICGGSGAGVRKKIKSCVII